MKCNKRHPHPYVTMCNNVYCKEFQKPIVTALVNCLRCGRPFVRYYRPSFWRRLWSKIFSR